MNNKLQMLNFSPWGKVVGAEANHLSPSSVQFKNVWSYTPTPPKVFMTWCLMKHRDGFKENK
jgi:hypothetical protein